MQDKYISANKLKAHYSWWGDTDERKTFDQIVDAQPAVNVVELPCRMGDPVFYLTGTSYGLGFNRVEESRCTGFLFDDMGMQVRLGYDWKGNHGTYGIWGETIFASRISAERALEKRNGNR